MSKIKDLIIDFVELNSPKKDFDDMMESLTNGDAQPKEDFNNFVKVWVISRKILEASGEKRLRWATKLWNAIDNLYNPEPCWRLMARDIPDAFRNPENINSIIFTR